MHTEAASFESARRLLAYQRSLGCEQEALDAGTVWWDGELFGGHPDWNKLLAYPKPQLSDEEQAFLDNEVEQLCAMLDDWDITHNRADLPPEVWQFIKDKGFFGMIIPKEFGGLGFSATAHSEVIRKISTRSITTAVTVINHLVEDLKRRSPND